MTKDVMVTISGFHVEEEESDTIEMVHIGQYFERNDTQYLLYDEQLEGMSEPVKNRIKIRKGKMELQKRGPVTTNMVFEEGKRESSTYAIPYGSFLMETYTKKVEFHLEEDCLKAKAFYELNINGVRYAKREVRIKAQSKKTFQL